jgi:type II secretory pathway pseudopilin PulG
VGFTLIELLTVIAIIIALAALLTPAVIKLFEKSTMQKAAAQLQAITHAIQQYDNTYGKYPGQVQGDEDMETGLSTTVRAQRVLTNLLSNPRSRTFIEYPDHWVSSDGTFHDPYEQEILIVMDENRDGQVNISISSPTVYSVVVSNRSVAVISFGPQPEDLNKWILSWMR